MTLQIDTIDTLADFERVADTWRRLYAADTSANVFVNWAWLRDWFEVTPYDWKVLAAKPVGVPHYVAFCPIAVATLRSYGLGLQSLLYLGGKPLADYTGFVCDPAYADDAVRAFARHIKERITWDRFRALHLMDNRADVFFGEFDDPAFKVRVEDDVPAPYLELPDSFDQFLAEYMSSKSRATIRRRMRQCEKVAGFRSTRTDMNTFDEHIAIVLRMWQERWGKFAPGDEELYRSMYDHALRDGRLWMHLLWDGPTLMAGDIAILDAEKHYFGGQVIVFNPAYQQISPGSVIIGHAIRGAIEGGYRFFDFLLGGEAYKTDYFGAAMRYAKSLTVERIGFKHRVRKRLARWLVPPRPSPTRAQLGQERVPPSD